MPTKVSLMNFNDLKIIVGQIKKEVHCPRCKAHYTDEDIEVIGSLGDELSFFYACCPTCECQSVINVAIQYKDEISTLPHLAKLGSAPRLGNISQNEVLDMKNFLKEFKGDFHKLFQKK